MTKDPHSGWTNVGWAAALLGLTSVIAPLLPVPADPISVTIAWFVLWVCSCLVWFTWRSR